MFAPLVAKSRDSRRSGLVPRRPETPQAQSPSRLPGHPAPQSHWDFSAIPPRAPAADDPLEREADRVAGDVFRLPGPGAAPLQIASPPRLRADRVAHPPEPAHPAPAPESFQGRGEPLPRPLRRFFEHRLDHDFAGVRLHRGTDAAASARSLGASAYTRGRDIVLGAGEYAPGTRRSAQLLAHELAHVVQQGARRGVVQLSALSDSVKAAWEVDHKAETLLARLSEADVQSSQSDADVDAEIARILAADADNLWLAQKIRKGELGKTSGALGAKVAGKPVARPIQVYYFRGSTDRRALVIAGVHGTEQQGMEVARMLIADLQSRKPGLTTIVVPSLFPDNASVSSRESGGVHTNRNFPNPNEDLAASKAAGKGTAVAAPNKSGTRQAILPENLLLIELMERFKPERIISIHGTWGPGSAGVFYDRRTLRPDDVQAARQWAQGNAYMQMTPEQQEEPGGQEKLKALEERLFRGRLAQLSGEADTADRDLSLKAAGRIDTDTALVKGREGRDMQREKEALTPEKKKERQAHPSIAGNVGPGGALSNASWSGGTDDGVSLGGYAPQRGMSVFTVEPPVDAESARYPNGKDRVTGNADKLSQADRITELKSYEEAIRTILLAAP